MRRTVFAPFVVLVAAAACSPKPTVTHAELRDELLSRLERDQAVRDTFQMQLQATGTLTPALVASMQRVDSANLMWLRELIRAEGFPTRRQVGTDAVKAATLLVQHADADPAFQAEMLPTFESRYQAGELGGQEVALLADRVAKAHKRRQRYGTQTTIVEGRVVIDPIDDSAHVDERRAKMGLPSLAAYKRVLDSLFARRGSG